MNLRTVLLLFTGLAVFLFSCKKHSDNLFLANEGTLGFDGYSFADSFSLFTSTVREDSIKTDSLSHNLLGVIVDPDFGTSAAITYTQFKLPQIDKVISSERLDSAVLFLQFTSTSAYYGDLNSEIAFDIYELSESMNSSVTHSSQSYNYSSTQVGTFSGRFNLSDSLKIRSLGKTVKMAPGISIKLSVALATKLFNATLNDLHTQDNFLQFFKGLVMVPAGSPVSGSGAIAAINLQGAYTTLRVYYNDTLQSDFKVIDNARRFTQYKISGQNSKILNQKASRYPANFDTGYIQSMTGAKVFIKIPYLFGVIRNNAKKISVGKAEIFIRPVSGTYNSPFSLPTRLLLLQPNPDNNLNAGIIDLAEPFYGGSYNSINNEYKFNITRHIQSLFSDYQLRGINNNRGLFLIAPSDFPIAPSRMQVDTRKGIAKAGIEFKLIFTEL